MTMKITCKLCERDITDWNDVLPCPCGNIFCANCHAQFQRSEDVVEAIEGDTD